MKLYSGYIKFNENIWAQDAKENVWIWRKAETGGR